MSSTFWEGVSGRRDFLRMVRFDMSNTALNTDCRQHLSKHGQIHMLNSRIIAWGEAFPRPRMLEVSRNKGMKVSSYTDIFPSGFQTKPYATTRDTPSTPSLFFQTCLLRMKVSSSTGRLLRVTLVEIRRVDWLKIWRHVETKLTSLMYRRRTTCFPISFSTRSEKWGGAGTPSRFWTYKVTACSNETENEAPT